MNFQTLLKAFKLAKEEDRLGAIDRKIEANRQRRIKIKEESVALQREREALTKKEK